MAFSLLFIKSMEKALAISFLLGTLVFHVACDKACNKTVEDSAWIENRTQRSIQFRVCKRAGIEATLETVSMSPSSAPQQVTMGEHTEYEVIGGPSLKSCDSNRSSNSETHFVLSPSGFAEFKLCYDSQNHRSLVLDKNQSCPTGTIQQTSPGDCTVP
ncbi:MAG: hypothetical protein ACAH59_10240 [Pseudobdellovibrionaceae bacterium]